ncbi:MAG: electron transport complex subunit RsxC [Clostridia bacterium]|nr:electron transport complex subunit RsxC [Clostridia bacterium]
MAYTFRGGTHVAEHKHTRQMQIAAMPAPAKVSIPLSQHIGAHCKPLVQVGDHVWRGQLIGDVEEGLGCPVHASVSGTVTAIDTRNDANARPIVNIVIENDGEMALDPSITPYNRKLTETTTEEIIDIVRRAGISGMGGATFPTHAKIRSALGKVDRLIINCAECEPYITANHRLLLENPAAVINGAKILLKAFGLRMADIAIEDNKLDAINKIEQMVADSAMIRVRVLKTKYPQGDERQLIYALTGKALPAGKLPADVGCVVFNAETCAAIFSAFAYGMPLIERIVTVDGDCVSQPQNLLVSIGTSALDVIEACGGLRRAPRKLIFGGPMMGAAQWDIHTPVTKGTSAILVFSEKAEKQSRLPEACIHCGRCVQNCPMRLMPNYLAQYAKAGRLAEAEAFGALSCVECGTCSYNCPGQVQIVQFIRVAKGAINAEKAAARARAEAAKAESEKKEET